IDRTPAGAAESGRFLLALGLHLGGVVGHELLGDGGGRECPVRDLGHRRDLGRAAGDEALGELGELVRHDAPLDHLDAALLRHVDAGWAGDAVEEASAIGVWILPSLMKKMLAPVHSATRPCQSSIMASA